MVYKAAVIGCHGVGKTTLCNKLKSKGFMLFQEAPLNSFMGKNAFLSEVRIILDNILINKEISEQSVNVISDRFGFLDALIYSEGFFRLGWINIDQLKYIYELVNNSNHKWNFPEKLLCMTDDKKVIIGNIIKRDRDTRFNETNLDYLNTIYELYNDFYYGRLDLKFLSVELRNKIFSVPKVFVKCYRPSDDVSNFLNADTKEVCLM